MSRHGLFRLLVVFSIGTIAVLAFPAPQQPGLDLRTRSMDVESQPVSGGLTEHSIARIWNETLLDAIRIDRPKPPVHSRNLFHLSIAMWDAWAAYDEQAIGYLFTEKHTATDVAAARHEAISYAAYRLLTHRFPGGGFDPVDFQPCQPGAAAARADFDATLIAAGYDPAETSTVGDTPSAIGNRIGQTVIDFGATDGANEGPNRCYPDDTFYASRNFELIFDLPGTNGSVLQPNYWQRLAFDFLVLQNEIVIGTALQGFVGPGWTDVAPFGLTPADITGTDPAAPCTPPFGAQPPYFDPGCHPLLGGVGDAEVKDAIVEVIRYSSFVDPADPTMIDISPGAYGNNPLGTDDGTGHPVNPATGQPYAPNVVKRADFARVVAEFWADGPDSETPPGHWNTLANYVTDHPDFGERRIGGTGEVLDLLEWEVKLYLALNGAVHDAAIVAWGSKHFYDSSRPITLIRYMAEQGQSTDDTLPSYDPNGLPLVPDLIEVVTAASSAAGERHEDLAGHVGEIAIRVWKGGPADPATQVGGVGWILAINWMPYQADNFVTPPFPGYLSGHSTFSRAAAEVLTAFTGDPFWPGGLGTFVAEQNAYLSFEQGPSQRVELQWATYADAADEAGASRRYGGIHPYYDDFPAREIAVEVGQRAYAKALEFYNTPVCPGGDDEDSDDEDSDSSSDSDDEDSDSDSDSDSSELRTPTVRERMRPTAQGQPNGQDGEEMTGRGRWRNP